MGRKYSFNLQRVRGIFEQHQDPSVHDELRKYCEEVFKPNPGAGKTGSMGGAICAAIRTARKKGWLKPCHRANAKFVAWSGDKQKNFIERHYITGHTHEEIAADPEFAEDLRETKRPQAAFYHIVNFIGITQDQRNKRKLALVVRKNAAIDAKSKNAETVDVEVEPKVAEKILDQLRCELNPDLSDDQRSTIDSLSRLTGKSKKTVVMALEFLRQHGHPILRPSEGRRGVIRLLGGTDIKGRQEISIPRIYQDHHSMIVVSNPLLGHKAQQPSLLAKARDLMKETGAELMVIVGGLVAGKPTRTNHQEIFKHTATEQVEYAVRVIKSIFGDPDRGENPGFKIYVVAGKEELSFGLNLAVEICSQIPYMVYTNDIATTFFFEKIPVRFVYPTKGVERPYTLLYRMQQIAKAIIQRVAEKLRIAGSENAPKLVFTAKFMAAGGVWRGFPSITLPGLVRQTPSMESANISPAIGCVFAKIPFNENGGLRYEFSPEGEIDPTGGITVEFYDFGPYALENDWGSFPDLPTEELSILEAQAYNLLKQRPRSLGDLSRSLDIDSDTVMAIITRIKALLGEFMRNLYLKEEKDKLLAEGKSEAQISESSKEIGETVDGRLEDYESRRDIAESATKKITVPVLEKTSFVPPGIAIEQEFSLLSTSDTHFGSRMQQPEIMRMIYDYAVKVWRVRCCINCGDIFDGTNVYRGQSREVFADSPDAQVRVAAKLWPEAKRSLERITELRASLRERFGEAWKKGVVYTKDILKRIPTFCIGGNHDESVFKSVGHDPVRHLQELCPEIVYLGGSDVDRFCTEKTIEIDTNGLLVHKHEFRQKPNGWWECWCGLAVKTQNGFSEKQREKGLVIQLVHPRGAASIYRSYKGQKHIENILEYSLSEIFRDIGELKKLPHLYNLGNWHINAVFYYAGVWVFILPTMQAQTRFMKELGLTPDIGAFLVRAGLDKHGVLYRLTLKYLDMIPFVKERDWELEQAGYF